MKKQIIATAIALGFICVIGVSFAQDQTETTTMQNVVVTQQPAQYDTYVADLDVGYKLAAVVGNTHRQYVRARWAANQSEALRKNGQALEPVVSVALDNSAGAGMAKQIRLIDAAQNTVAIVNVYCKRAVPSGGPHCRLDPRPMGNSMASQDLASTRVQNVQLVEVALVD